MGNAAWALISPMLFQACFGASSHDPAELRREGDGCTQGGEEGDRGFSNGRVRVEVELNELRYERARCSSPGREGGAAAGEGDGALNGIMLYGYPAHDARLWPLGTVWGRHNATAGGAVA